MCMRYFRVRSIEEEALFDVRGTGGGFCKRLADPSQMLHRPKKAGLEAEGRSEGCA